MANTGDPNTDVMNPTLGLLEGTAHMTRQFPLLRKLGPYNLNAHTELLDNKWEFAQMRWVYEHRRLRANTDFRIPVVYTLPPAPDAAALAMAYATARQAILNLLFPSGMAVPGPLWPLDRDTEFVYYSALFGWGTGAPDFHPRLRSFCSLDSQEVETLVQQLIDRIQGDKDRGIHELAWQMTQAFINLYTRAIQAYQNHGMSPPPQLQQDIDTLNQYLQTLK